MATTYTSYSVGAITIHGQEIGWQGRDRADADRSFAHFRSLAQVASVSMFGWDDETGECDELAAWCV